MRHYFFLWSFFFLQRTFSIIYLICNVVWFFLRFSRNAIYDHTIDFVLDDISFTINLDYLSYRFDHDFEKCDLTQRLICSIIVSNFDQLLMFLMSTLTTSRHIIDYVSRCVLVRVFMNRYFKMWLFDYDDVSICCKDFHLSNVLHQNVSNLNASIILNV